MKLPDYVTKDEVKRVCKELGIRNWAALKKVAPRVKEALKIKAAIGTAGIRIGAEDFRDGLEVELEHGTRYPEANVTNNHPVLTGEHRELVHVGRAEHCGRIGVREIYALGLFLVRVWTMHGK
jgi:hypothetical protein